MLTSMKKAMASKVTKAASKPRPMTAVKREPIDEAILEEEKDSLLHSYEGDLRLEGLRDRIQKRV